MQLHFPGLDLPKRRPYFLPLPHAPLVDPSPVPAPPEVCALRLPQNDPLPRKLCASLSNGIFSSSNNESPKKKMFTKSNQGGEGTFYSQIISYQKKKKNEDTDEPRLGETGPGLTKPDSGLPGAAAGDQPALPPPLPDPAPRAPKPS